jgi:hypothetical protein
VVFGLPSKSQPANAVVSGPPSEWPPQKTFLVRSFLGMPRRMTVYSSRTVWSSPTAFRKAASCSDL